MRPGDHSMVAYNCPLIETSPISNRQNKLTQVNIQYSYVNLHISPLKGKLALVTPSTKATIQARYGQNFGLCLDNWDIRIGFENKYFKFHYLFDRIHFS